MANFESVKEYKRKSVLITSTSSTTPININIVMSKYDYLILRITNSAGTTIYGSDIVLVDAIKDNDIIDIIRYFNVLSGNFTGTLKHNTGNSFSISSSNSNYVVEVYGIEK